MSNDQGDRFSELVEDKKIWEGLLLHPGWAKLVAILQAQADSLQVQVVHTPLKSGDDVYTQEWCKGRLCGLLSVSSTVEGVLADLNDELEFLKGAENAG